LHKNFLFVFVKKEVHIVSQKKEVHIKLFVILIKGWDVTLLNIQPFGEEF
jgi:hypothetical protein